MATRGESARYPSATARSAGDLDLWSLAWYGQPLRRLVARAGLELVTPEDPGPLRDVPLRRALPGVASGHVVAASGNVPAPGGATVVVTGPCLGDGARGLTAEAVVDTCEALLVGAALAAPVVVYLGDEEEALSAGGSGRWAQVAERFAAWLPVLAAALDVPVPTAVMTSSASHQRALAAAGGAARSLAGEVLDAAFHLGSQPAREQPEATRAISRRVVEAHLPSVVAAHAGLARDAPPRVVIAANLQQAGTWAAAAALAPESPPAFVGHFPVPSLSGWDRSYRAESWDKGAAADIERLASGEGLAESASTRAYFAAWLDGATRSRLAAAAERHRGGGGDGGAR